MWGESLDFLNMFKEFESELSDETETSKWITSEIVNEEKKKRDLRKT